MTATRYRQIEVSGSPSRMGEQLGEAAREEIRGFNAIALERVNKTVPVSRPRALACAAACVEEVRQYSPAMLAELEGMGRASGVSVPELMLLQIRNQLRPEGDAGCTAFALSPATATGHLVGQNWDNDPALDPFTVVLTRRPEGAPAHLSLTQAGLIAYIGVNDAGLGLCMNTLPAPSRPTGVPHYFTVRAILEARSLKGAVAAVERARRAIPANILLATPQGPADLEVTLDAVHVLTDPAGQLLTHTNHCLHPDLAAINDGFPELIQSRPRQARVAALLAGLPRPVGVAGLQQVLRDHEGYPTSICRHANDHPGDGYWTSVFSVVIEADARRLHASRGNPCCRPYETYALN
ncbi:MAG: C45 family peptidase [Gemmatimonadota bacterium]